MIDRRPQKLLARLPRPLIRDPTRARGVVRALLSPAPDARRLLNLWGDAGPDILILTNHLPGVAPESEARVAVALNVIYAKLDRPYRPSDLGPEGLIQIGELYAALGREQRERCGALDSWLDRYDPARALREVS